MANILDNIRVVESNADCCGPCYTLFRVKATMKATPSYS